MKFLLEQDVSAVTERFLREKSQDVITASLLDLSRAKVSGLLKITNEQGWIFVTRDRDFGNLVFVRGVGGGVLYLRMLPSTMEDVHNEMMNVLKTLTKRNWQNRLW